MHASYPYNAESPVFDNQAMTGLVADSNQAGDVVLNAPIQVANNVNDSLVIETALWQSSSRFLTAWLLTAQKLVMLFSTQVG